VDLIDEAKMSPAEVEAAARRLGVRLYRACVKDNVNVSEVFDYLATQVGSGVPRALRLIQPLFFYPPHSSLRSTSCEGATQAASAQLQQSGITRQTSQQRAQKRGGSLKLQRQKLLRETRTKKRKRRKNRNQRSPRPRHLLQDRLLNSQQPDLPPRPLLLQRLPVPPRVVLQLAAEDPWPRVLQGAENALLSVTLQLQRHLLRPMSQ
jgi:hypothetical protein